MKRRNPTVSVLALALALTAVPPAAEEQPVGCDLEGAGTAMAGKVQAYTQDEIKVIRYVADRLVAGDPPRFTEADLAQGAGVPLEVIEGLETRRLQQGLIAEFSRRGLDASSLGGNCTKFSACSIDRDLSGATGEELARYEQERSQDGAVMKDWPAPDFSLRTTAGTEVSLSSLHGRDVALVFLAGHCSHSMETLPLLAELAADYGPRGLEVLPIYINSGSVEDVRSWSRSLGVTMPLLVADGRNLSEAYRFRMVPTIFLIDADGMVTRKLVGQQDRAALSGAFDALLGAHAAGGGL